MRFDRGAKNEKYNIDMWMGSATKMSLSSTLSMLLQIGHIMRMELDEVTELRLIKEVDGLSPDCKLGHTALQAELQELVATTRIKMPQLLLIECAGSSMEDRNELFRRHSASTCLLIAELPLLPALEDATEYWAGLHTLTAGLPSVALVCKGQQEDIISTAI